MEILNYGCGYDVHKDALNVDIRPCVEGVVSAHRRYEWMRKEAYDEIRLFHVVEHMTGMESMELMETFYYCARPDAELIIRCPYGATDDAWENPEHVRPLYEMSFTPYSQLYWWREHTDYTADWQPHTCTFMVTEKNWDDNYEAMYKRIRTERNIVTEMEVKLRCVKPKREIVKGTKPEREDWGVYVLDFRKVIEA